MFQEETLNCYFWQKQVTYGPINQAISKTEKVGSATVYFSTVRGPCPYEQAKKLKKILKNSPGP